MPIPSGGGLNCRSRDRIIFPLMLVVFFYHLLYSLGIYESFGLFLPPMVSRALSFGLISIIIVLDQPKLWSGRWFKYIAILSVCATLLCFGYIVLCYDYFFNRIGHADNFEAVLGILAIVLCLILTNLTAGKGMVISCLIFIAYALVGSYLPRGFFRSPPTSIKTLSGQTYLGLMGIWGVPIGVIVDYIFAFLLFAFAFRQVGGVKLFVQISSYIFRKMVGTSAKMAIALNGLLGMVNGSTIANVLISGPICIPRMREEGYTEAYSGALVATAATAAQVTPPVMGIVAFVMAELLSTPYLRICGFAIIPSFLFYLSLILFAHIEAVRKGMKRLTIKTGKNRISRSFFVENWPPLLGFAVLICLLASERFTLRLAVTLCSLFVFMISFLRKETRPNLQQVSSIIKETIRGLNAIAPVSACAGIIIASIGVTALDFKFTTQLITVVGDNVLLILFFAMIASIMLGMGMPTLPAYLVVALLITPPLLKAGIEPIVSHFFVFYMAMSAMITPPVCLNVYAVAPMVKASTWKIGLTSLWVGMASFVVPFLFVYEPGLLGQGGLVKIFFGLISGILVIIAICVTVLRYGLTHAHWIELVTLLPGALLLFCGISERINWGYTSYTIGGLLILVAATSHLIRWRQLRGQLQASSL